MIAAPNAQPKPKDLTKCEHIADRVVHRLLARMMPEHQAELLVTPEFRRRVNPALLRKLLRRVAKDLAQQREQVAALGKSCQCRLCIKRGTQPFPSYYVINRLSYECHLERQEIDPELEELLAPLRNDRPRAGSVVISRPRPPGHSTRL
jgi:hypothetical protein